MRPFACRALGVVAESLDSGVDYGKVVKRSLRSTVSGSAA
jgi:hypothetical protein